MGPGTLFREIDPKSGQTPLFPDWVLVEVKNDWTNGLEPKETQVCKFVKFTPNFKRGDMAEGLDAFQSTLEIPIDSLMSPRSRFRSVWSGGLQVNVLANDRLLQCSSYPLPHIFRIYGRYSQESSYTLSTDWR